MKNASQQIENSHVLTYDQVVAARAEELYGDHRQTQADLTPALDLAANELRWATLRDKSLKVTKDWGAYALLDMAGLGGTTWREYLGDKREIKKLGDKLRVAHSAPDYEGRIVYRSEPTGGGFGSEGFRSTFQDEAKSAQARADAAVEAAAVHYHDNEAAYHDIATIEADLDFKRAGKPDRIVTPATLMQHEVELSLQPPVAGERHTHPL